MDKGYVAIWRKLSDSDFWLSEKFTRGQAWIDLLLLANHKDGFFYNRGIRVEIKRGQVGRSELSLAKRWKWSRGKVRRFLSELSSEKERKIVQQKSNVSSTITILNYDVYQFGGTPDGHQTVHQTDTKRYTNNNDNNVNNDNNKRFLSDSIEIGLAEALHEKILLNNPSTKKPNFQSWAKTFDLMLRIDKRTPEQIKAIIDWAQGHHFWHRNILSPAKLRKQFDRLVLESKNGGSPKKYLTRSERNKIECMKFLEEKN
jgi:hypothetical protein